MSSHKRKRAIESSSIMMGIRLHPPRRRQRATNIRFPPCIHWMRSADDRWLRKGKPTFLQHPFCGLSSRMQPQAQVPPPFPIVDGVNFVDFQSGSTRARRGCDVWDLSPFSATRPPQCLRPPPPPRASSRRSRSSCCSSLSGPRSSQAWRRSSRNGLFSFRRHIISLWEPSGSSP
jgi:hypothetical protein